MTRKQHINISKHVWRTLRSLLALAAAWIWLYTDMTSLVFIMLILVALVDQFKGFVCYVVEKALHWKNDFDPLG